MYPSQAWSTPKPTGRSFYGRIDYIASDGRHRGRERFLMHCQADGTRTVHVHCEIDETALLRHVVQQVDANFRPLEASVNVSRAGVGVTSGHVWFSFRESAVAVRAGDGDAALQRCPLVRPAMAYGTHPLVVDGWMAALYTPGGERIQPLPDVYVSSLAFDGRDTVGLYPVSVALELLGREPCRTPAGDFDCHHLRYHFGAGGMAHPPYETWVTADEDHLLVKAWAGEPFDYTYLLADLSGRETL